MTPAGVLLISPPWRLSTWPSLALGTLKSYLRSVGIQATCSHLHFDVAIRFGLERYDFIASGWELGEALYFSLYDPAEADALLARTADHLLTLGQARMAGLCSSEVAAELQSATLAAVERLDLPRYRLIGLSVGALQLGAAIYLVEVIRDIAPGSKVVLGGSSLIGEVGHRILELVPGVDALVDGEGEAALEMLARDSDWTAASLARVPNLRFRDEQGKARSSPLSYVMPMAAITAPDMDEYFEAVARADIDLPTLVMPLEASRGCLWEHRRGDNTLRGCTFCGLYRGSPNFREKPMHAVLRDIEWAANRYGALEVSFTDAYLPPSYAKSLLREIIARDLDVTLFCEMRCDLDAETAALLARAGARQVQLGVEAINTKILRRMAKGTRAIDNIYAIKLCEEYSVPLQYNLISRFPSVTAEELDETLTLMPSLYGYVAPSIATFYLDRGSRIFMAPTRFGLDSESFDHEPLPFVPMRLARAAISQIVWFDIPTSAAVTTRWEQVEAGVSKWQQRQEVIAAGGVRHGLSFRDTGRQLIIIDHREEEPLVVKLEGMMRDLLLACSDIVPRQFLLEYVPSRSQERLEAALALFHRHRLIVEEGQSVLGLPVRAKLPNGATRRSDPARSDAALREI